MSRPYLLDPGTVQEARILYEGAHGRAVEGERKSQTVRCIPGHDSVFTDQVGLANSTKSTTHCCSRTEGTHNCYVAPVRT